jgi:mRNA interferase MazF
LQSQQCNTVSHEADRACDHPIGNSRGIRIPAEILRRHRIGDAVLLEERGDELVLRPKKQTKLSWKENIGKWLLKRRTGRIGKWSLKTGWMNAKQFDIVLVNLDPVLGSEMAKTRPAVVVSKDEMNAALETVVVCPLTTKLHPPLAQSCPNHQGGKRAEIAVDQIRTVQHTAPHSPTRFAIG